MKSKHHRESDKKLTLKAILRRFDEWNDADDLPAGTTGLAENLFRKTNAHFSAPTAPKK